MLGHGHAAAGDYDRGVGCGGVHFCHSSEIWGRFPQLVPGALVVAGVAPDARVEAQAAAYLTLARSRLADSSEGELPQIRAWRRAFSAMGLKPTQYRCAAESLLRRLRREGSLPRIHPLVDLCNAVSVAFAIPIAVFDTARVADWLEVRHASGSELYETFSGEAEQPEPGEVIFADAAGNAHARRWTNRQSRASAVSAETTDALIVAEALHDSAAEDMDRLVSELSDELTHAGAEVRSARILTASAPRFDL
jgi:DNA/RNA-binding domain of Phe-tRNA-synthetase-like protein